MEIGDLIIRTQNMPITHQFRAAQIKEALFMQLEDEAKHGLMCFIDKFGEPPAEDCRGYRIHKIPEGKKVAIVRPTHIPDVVWSRAFPLEGVNLTPPEQAKAALEALDVKTIVQFLSTYTLEELLAAKGIERANCKIALDIALKVEEAFTLLEKAVNESYEKNKDGMCLLLLNKLSGWKGEILHKCKIGLEQVL